MFISKKTQAILGITLLFSMSLIHSVYASGENMMINRTASHFNYAEKFKTELAKQEEVYQPILQMQGVMDKADVHIYRYQAATEALNLGGQHFSVVIDSAGRLKGMTRMNLGLMSNSQLSADNTEKIARAFLSNYAPDLLTHLELQWIKPHDETIMAEDGKQHKLIGMKVKCRDTSTGLYFWVVVAADESVMIFERDINWNFIVGGRQTEKWLHDSWLSGRLD